MPAQVDLSPPLLGGEPHAVQSAPTPAAAAPVPWGAPQAQRDRMLRETLVLRTRAQVINCGKR